MFQKSKKNSKYSRRDFEGMEPTKTPWDSRPLLAGCLQPWFY